MAVIDDVRALGTELERSYHAYVHGRLKFRVGAIVYAAFSLDESVMGFAFPKEERAALVAGDPRKFQMPSASELRFNWVHADLASLEPTEAREFVVDAWRMVVPNKLSRAYDLAHLNVHPRHSGRVIGVQDSKSKSHPPSGFCRASSRSSSRAMAF